MPPEEDRDRAARLLLKALDSLSARDRGLVLRSLLTGQIGVLSAPEPHGHLYEQSLPTRFGTEVTRQLEQPLLVRLPAELHSRLRRWAATHGFSMASIVRGLVERFLDDQETHGRSTKPGA